MGYAAARGGTEAIVAAEGLLRRQRDDGETSPLSPDQVVQRLGLAIDRVMGEAGLWAPELAARALTQAQGDLIEAAHLLRAYCSTRPRLARPSTVEADELVVLRRIVPAYREPPGPQILGSTSDYTARLLEAHDPSAPTAPLVDGGEDPPPPADRRPGRLLDLLRREGLAVDHRRADDPDPFDVARQPVRPGVPRSARLSVMARAETGALVNLWYRNVLGPDGYVHEITLGEVRHGRLPVRVDHGITGEPVDIGVLRVTEVEAIEDLDAPDERKDLFDVGYGLCLGHNERKAIAMANLDIAVERDRGRSPLEQSVLMTTDALDSSGFLEHLKLPHYVTFRSMIERKLAVRRIRELENEDAVGDAQRELEPNEIVTVGAPV
jgi:alpha-D-ribose 1-methylphosphonate 5-triphosphate synthase subunit PhnI